MAVQLGSVGKRYPNNVDPILGYAPGTILSNEVADYRSFRAAEAILVHRYREKGLASLHNIMMLVDNCRLPEYFKGPEYEERHLSNALVEERLDRLAKVHLGGDHRFSTLSFNRTTAAIMTTILALATPGSVVPFLVPKYPKASLKGHGHPSVPRAVELARAQTRIATTASEVGAILDKERVTLIVICPSYRQILPEAEIKATCELGRARGIPVFVDDASGARFRTIGDGQTGAIDLGADIVVTSCEKYGLDGPRAGLIVGRKELMERIGAKSTVLGTESRPSVTAAIARCLEEFTFEQGRATFDEWATLHRPVYEAMREVFGERVVFKPYGGISILVEDIIEIAMERAGIQETPYAPVDIAAALAMVLLRNYGYMTVAALSYPGAAKSLMIHLAQPSARTLRPAEIAEAVDQAFTLVAHLITSRDKLDQVLFGPPELTVHG